MTRTAWITATPRVAETGAATTVRLAGGGDRAPYYRAGHHYRAGLTRLPRFRAGLGFDADGWTGGTVPQSSNLIFKPGQPELVDQLAALYWIDAPITIEAGVEGGAVSTLFTGTVASAAVVDDGLVHELGDLSKGLDKPAIAVRFAGNGGAEGGSEAAGRVKRRSWGRVFNVEGRILDKANNVFEFGDPAYPWQAIDVLRDKGRAAAPAPAVLAWQGSVAATLAALKASAPAEGSGVVAPSIACAKWWTQPAGPLTADVRGEIGAGYVESAPEISARILAAFGGPAIANVGAMTAVRPDPAGFHIGDDSETVAQALDRLILGVSLLWILEPAGTIRLREWSFAAPVETVIARSVSRRRSFAPVMTRRLGYQRAHRTHNDGEIAAVLQVGDVSGLAPIATDQDAKPKLDGIQDGATAGASWTGNVSDRPVELTDGTVLDTQSRAQNLTTAGRAGSGMVSAADGRPFSKIVATGEANNGATVTFPSTYATVPKITFLPGGKAPAAGANVAIRADNLSASGFTLKAAEQTVTPGSTITDGGSTAGGVGEPERVIDRSNSGAPYNGAFKFTITVSVPQIAPGEPGYLTVGFFTKSGGVWAQRRTETYTANGAHEVSVSALADFGSGAEFGVSVIESDSGGGVSFNSVSYSLGTVTESSLTTISPIPFFVMLEQ